MQMLIEHWNFRHLRLPKNSRHHSQLLSSQKQRWLLSNKKKNLKRKRFVFVLTPTQSFASVWTSMIFHPQYNKVGIVLSNCQMFAIDKYGRKLENVVSFVKGTLGWKLSYSLRNIWQLDKLHCTNFKCLMRAVQCLLQTQMMFFHDVSMLRCNQWYFIVPTRIRKIF